MLTDSALFVSAGDIGYLPMVPTSAYEAPRWSTLYFNIYFTVLGSTGSIIVLNPMKPTKDNTADARASGATSPVRSPLGHTGGVKTGPGEYSEDCHCWVATKAENRNSGPVCDFVMFHRGQALYRATEEQ